MGVLIQGGAFIHGNMVSIKNQSRDKYQVTEKCEKCIKSTVKHIPTYMVKAYMTNSIVNMLKRFDIFTFQIHVF